MEENEEERRRRRRVMTSNPIAPAADASHPALYNVTWLPLLSLLLEQAGTRKTCPSSLFFPFLQEQHRRSVQSIRHWRLISSFRATFSCFAPIDRLFVRVVAFVRHERQQKRRITTTPRPKEFGIQQQEPFLFFLAARTACFLFINVCNDDIV
jgi:hypothetical protein